MKTLVLVAMSLLSAAAAHPDVHGRVSTGEGRPIAGATAYIYTAGVKVGTSPYCPSCYPDCGKSAKTDTDGTFKISSLHPDLRFRVLVVAEGYKPAIVDGVDPIADKTVEVKLAAMPEHLDPARVLKGRVIGPDGKPVLAAIVTPEGCQTEHGRWWGAMPGVDPMSITNARGEFIVTSDKPAIAYAVKVEARGLATKNFATLPLGEQSHDLRLGEGAAVIGRLLKDGKPLAGMNVGLVQDNRGVEIFTGPRAVGTDADGRFTFLNVGPAGAWNVYGVMSSIAERGAVQVETVHVDGENTTSDAGDLSVGPSHKLSGRVVLSDGQPIPPNTRLQLDRAKAWDSQIVVLDDAGRFAVDGVPAEEVHVSVMVKGYRLSKANRSLDLLNLIFLRGRVDRDINDLTILLEPGKVSMPDRQQLRAIAREARAISEARIEGVRP